MIVFFSNHTLMLGYRGEVSGELGLMSVEILSSKYDIKREGEKLEGIFKELLRVIEHVF